MIPFPEKTIFLPISNPEAHFGNSKYAVDFVVRYNVPILAAQDGIVTDVKDDFNEGGADPKYAKKANYITIQHEEEFSQYIHLAHNSALVKVGDKVKQGQKIATSIGMTGYTTAPHLHFMVFHFTKDSFQTLEIQWATPQTVYTSQNLPLNKPEIKKLLEDLS